MLSRSAHRLEIGETNGCVCVYSGIGLRSIVESVPDGSLPRALTENNKSEQSTATVVFEDNLGAVSTSRSNKITPRTKYIDIKFHHVRSLVADKVVDVKYIKTGFQKADILTKSLGALKFISNRLMLLGE